MNASCTIVSSLTGRTVLIDIIQDLPSRRPHEHPVAPERQTLSDASGATHSYDARNRLTFIDHPIGTSDISYSYFADGALHTAATATSTWSYSYDKRGLLRNETLATNGLSLPVNYSYTTLGHRASVQYPDGATVNRLPNALGQASRAGNLATNASYHRNGALAGFTYGDGHVYSLALNTRQLPLQRSELRNGVQLLNYAYTYDGNGNVLTLLDQRPGGNETRTLAYDALNRMTQADAPGLLGFETYRYDALDNLRKAEFVGASRADLHITYGINAGNNRLSSIELAQGGTPYQHHYSHDARGNHTTGTTGVQAYTRTFNALNQMTAVFLPGQTDYYWYDAHGRRTTLQRNNQVTTQLYSRDGQLLYERSPAGVGTRHVYLGGRLVASTTGSSTTWQHTDHLGSPVRRTNAAGTQTGMTIFAPYGSLVAGTVDQGPGFTGHVNDTGSGLVYMQQRHYDPIAMRFVSVDPVHVDTGTGGNFNRYWYANNNPFRYIDPDGRAACPTGTRICYDSPRTESGSTQQGGRTEQQTATAKQVVSARRSGRLSDGTRLNLRGGKEQGFSASPSGTRAATLTGQGCVRCSDGKTRISAGFDASKLGPEESGGHTHPSGVGPLPGPEDGKLASATGKTAYVISERGTFAIEKTDVGYRVWQFDGARLSRDEASDVRSTIDSWNQHQGGSGVSCVPGC